jgi:hypothetical protein
VPRALLLWNFRPGTEMQINRENNDGTLGRPFSGAKGDNGGMQINGENTDGALALGSQNGPRSLAVVLPSSLLARVGFLARSSGVCGVKPCRGLRNVIGGEEVFFLEKLITGSHLLSFHRA